MNNNIEKDIFDILGISGREDSYTDLIYSIFEASDEFKHNILNEFFECKGDIKELNMKIRSCHFIPNGKRKKIIPDIILYTKDRLVIIEAKIFSSEGENQLSSYSDGVEEIKNQLKLNGDVTVGKYYLTLDRFKDLPGEFISLTWKDFADLIPRKINNESMNNGHILNICINDLIKRVDDYDKYSAGVVRIEDNKKFEEIYKWHQFVSYEKILKQMFKDEFDSKQYKHDIWEGWETSENCYAASIQVYCDKSWISDSEIPFSVNDEGETVTNKDLITVKNNYDVHYEIKIIGNNKLEFRIDYHTNPYLTNNEVKEYGLSSLHECRAEVIRKFNDNHKDECGKLNKAQGKALYVYKETLEIDDNCTVGDFKNIINNLIENNKDKVEKLISIIKS